MKAPWSRLRRAGDSAILLDFGDTFDPSVSRVLQSTATTIRGAGVDGIWGVVPAYTTVLVEFDPLVINGSRVVTLLESMEVTVVPTPQRCLEVPVLYGGDCGRDLTSVAHAVGLSKGEVVLAHTGQPYLVYCIGFAPGFPMCGTLPASLQLPRRSSPRTEVPSGSVAIAGAQTGIYPVRSPGGWHLIGRTPAVLFDLEQDPPVPYQPGDLLQFRSVAGSEFAELEQAAASGEHVIRELPRATH